MRQFKSQIRIALLAISAAVATGFGGWFLASTEQKAEPVEEAPIAAKPVPTQPVAPEPQAPAEAPSPAPANADGKAALEQKLKDAPEYQAFFGLLRSLYPADYDAAIKSALDHGADKQDNAADLTLTEAVQKLRQTRGLNGAKAGGQALDHLFDVHLKVLRQLSATNPALCVDFLNGAPADRFAAFTGANRALMADEALAGLSAIDDGAHKKIEREAPTTQDFDELEKLLLTRGLDHDAIAMLLDGKTPEPPPSAEQACRNGVVYLEALQSLPELQRLRLYALALEVMAHE